MPILRSEPEAFIRKEADGKKADSIGSQKPAARSAFGTTADDYAIFVAVSGKGQESGTVGVSLPELADLMKRLGCVQAINLDGGASTSLYVKLKTDNAVNSATGAAVCAKVPETRVRSILMLMPKKSPSRLPGRPGEPSLR